MGDPVLTATMQLIKWLSQVCYVCSPICAFTRVHTGTFTMECVDSTQYTTASWIYWLLFLSGCFYFTYNLMKRMYTSVSSSSSSWSSQSSQSSMSSNSYQIATNHHYQDNTLEVDKVWRIILHPQGPAVVSVGSLTLDSPKSHLTNFGTSQPWITRKPSAEVSWETVLDLDALSILATGCPTQMITRS